MINTLLILAAVGDFLLGVILIIKGKKEESTFAFAEFCLWVGLWTLGIYMFRVSESLKSALFWNREFIFTAGMIAVSFLHFSLMFTNKQVSTVKKFILYLPSVLILWGVFTPDVFIENIVVRNWGKESILGFGYWFYGLFFVSYMTVGLYLIFMDYIRSKSLKKMRLKYILLVIIPSSLVGVYFNLILILFANYRYIWAGPYSSFILVAGTTYAIAKYRLMEVRMALTRGSLFGFIYTLLLGIPFLLYFYGKPLLSTGLGEQWLLAPIILAVILGSLGPKMYSTLKEKTEWKLFTKQKQYQDTLISMGEKMTLTKNLNDLLTWITRAITINVGISHTRIFLWDEDKEEYTLRKEYGIERRSQFELDLNNENPVIEYLNKHKEPALRDEIISYYEIRDKKKAVAAGKTLRNTGAELIVPSFIKGKLIGFLTMGLKRNHRIYTPEDINMFKILAGQASLAIENAQFYDKVKQSEARLVQASKMSSIGQLATGFAHNINNPFNSIIANAGAMKYFISKYEEDLETQGYIKLDRDLYTDIINYTDSIKSSAFNGADIVKSITKFSEPTTGEKKPVDLNEVIDEGINLSFAKIKDTKVQLKKDIPEDVPKVLGDIVQLEQVFMNFITNACDAMNSKDERVLEIKARKANEEGMVRVDFKDTGEGIADDIKDKIFDYFFTTKRNAGTGLGLALTYEMIKRHNGRIEVESKVGEGSTFTVYLPFVGKRND
ncbi:MAG: ATP-binding protein [Elusimicrobiota bacterium]